MTAPWRGSSIGGSRAPWVAPGVSRRGAILGGSAVAASVAAPVAATASTPDGEAVDKAIAEITGGAKVNTGRVGLLLPDLAENGNAVSLVVTVESPMTEAAHVKTIHLLSEKNPITTVGRFHLGPRAGVARVATNIRLAVSQKVVALAALSDGSFWRGERSVVVTLAACVEGG